MCAKGKTDMLACEVIKYKGTWNCQITVSQDMSLRPAPIDVHIWCRRNGFVFVQELCFSNSC
jgi:hypothetical protein